MAPAILSNKYVRALLIAASLLLALFLSYLRVFESYELQTYDWRCQLRIPRPMSKDIVLIEISEDTLQHLGEWPIGRDNYYNLIAVLNKYKAKSIFFDVLFSEPRENDLLVEKAASVNGRIFFPVAFKNPKRIHGRFESKEFIVPLLESYEKVAKGVMAVNTIADLDGKRRRIIPVISKEGRNYYQLGVFAAIDSLGLREDKDITIRDRSIQLGKNTTIPLDEEGTLIVNYATRWSKDLFEHYSLFQIIASEILLQQGEKPFVNLKNFKNKICIIGGTATATTDVNATPIDSISPNVGIHANVLNTILERDFIRRLDRSQNVLILFLLMLGVLYSSLKMKPVAAFRTQILILVFYTVLVLFVFFHWGLWIDLFYPVALSIVIYAAATLSRTLYEVKKRELLENELKIASQIQKSFLPPAVPEQAGLDIAVFMKPAKAVGGDLYTFIPLQDGCLGVMLGDVSGKGTPAALFMAKAVSEFKFSSRDQNDPAKVLSNFNHSIASESTGGLFVTLTYVIFDIKNQKLFMSNGGHLPMAHVSASQETELISVSGGMPIGVLDGVTFDKMEKEIKPGDCFALYSDGVSEARNKKKEEFGIEALQKVMQENQALTAQGILDTAVKRLAQFTGKADQHDDITLLIVKVNSL